MFKYNHLLIQLNKIKYIGTVAVCGISSIFIFVASRLFIIENTGYSVWFPAFFLQIFYLLQYIFIRAIYKNELYLTEKDTFSIFIINKENKKKIFFDRFVQISIFYFMSYLTLIGLTVLLYRNGEMFRLIILTSMLSYLIVLFIYFQEHLFLLSLSENFLSFFLRSILFLAGGILFYQPNKLTICLFIVAVFIMWMDSVLKVWRQLCK